MGQSEDVSEDQHQERKTLGGHYIVSQETYHPALKEAWGGLVTNSRQSRSTPNHKRNYPLLRRYS